MDDESRLMKGEEKGSVIPLAHILTRIRYFAPLSSSSDPSLLKLRRGK